MDLKLLIALFYTICQTLLFMEHLAMINPKTMPVSPFWKNRLQFKEARLVWEHGMGVTNCAIRFHHWHQFKKDSSSTFGTPYSQSLFDTLLLTSWPRSWLYRTWCWYRICINPLSSDGIQSCGHRSGKSSKSNGRTIRKWQFSDNPLGALTIEHRTEWVSLLRRSGPYRCSHINYKTSMM